MFKKEDNWKITIEHYGNKYSIELGHADVNYEDVYNALKGILSASGWSDEQVDIILNREEDE